MLPKSSARNIVTSMSRFTTENPNLLFKGEADWRQAGTRVGPAAAIPWRSLAYRDLFITGFLHAGTKNPINLSFFLRLCLTPIHCDCRGRTCRKVLLGSSFENAPLRVHSEGVCPAGAAELPYNDYLKAGKLVIFAPIANQAAGSDHALERI